MGADGPDHKQLGAAASEQRRLVVGMAGQHGIIRDG